MSRSTHPRAAAPPGGIGWQSRCLVVLLLVLLAGQAVSSMRRKSVTTDEIMYIAAGAYHLGTGDFRLNMTNTPLMKMLSALPLQFIGTELPPLDESPEKWSLTRQWQYSREFLYDNVVDADRILFAARLPIVLLAVVLGIYVFRWSAALFGPSAGLFSLFLFSFSPNILAHSRLATHDLGLAAFMFIATYYFWRYMSEPRLRTLIGCGVATGLALLAKTTAIFLAPVFCAYVAISIIAGNGVGVNERFPFVDRIDSGNVRMRQALSSGYSLCIIGLITLLVLNIGYGFQGSFQPIPVPRPFLIMVAAQSRLVSNLSDFYFAGDLHSTGVWYLTVMSLLLKTPIPLLILIGASLVVLARRWRTLEGEWLVVSFIVVVVLVFTFIVQSSVGLRYVLPIFPFMHVLAGSVWKSARIHSHFAMGAVIVLSGWYLLSSARIYPHYIAYFNELIGGPENGYRYLADSNLDWGQDLTGLSEYMKNNDVNHINLGYFGSADARHYGISYDYLPSVGLVPKEEGQQWWYEITEPAPRIHPQPELYAISANLISSHGWMKPKFYEAYTEFRNREPDAKVGYSILIFDFTEPNE